MQLHANYLEKSVSKLVGGPKLFALIILHPDLQLLITKVNSRQIIYEASVIKIAELW